MPTTDFTASAYEYLSRKRPVVLQSGCPKPILTFMDAYSSRHPTKQTATLPEILSTIKKLHREKDAAYGSAWKRRGELVSILANIARKVDRLEQFEHRSATLADETIFDTAVDLFVYLLKYELFLREPCEFPELAVLPREAPIPYSDHTANFDTLVDSMAIPEGSRTTASETVKCIALSFEALHVLASERRGTSAERLKSVIQLRTEAFSLVQILHKAKPSVLDTFRNHR